MTHAFAVLATVVCMAAALTGCVRRDDEESINPAYNVRHLYTDRETLCEYVGNSSGPTTPRIAADGKTHMGCTGGAK